MKRVLEASRYLALIAVVFGLIAAAAAFGLGAVKTVGVVLALVAGKTDGQVTHLVQVMDAFLLAAALLIFAIGLYELFIGKLDVPEALLVGSLGELKSKLAAVIVLVLAVFFLEELETLERGLDILCVGGGVALVGAMLIFFTRGD